MLACSGLNLKQSLTLMTRRSDSLSIPSCLLPSPLPLSHSLPLPLSPPPSPRPAPISVVTEAISGAKITGPEGGLLVGVAGGVNMTCGAAAGVVSRRVWLKNGAPLQMDGRTMLLANNSLLSILPLGKEHRGTYTCTLSNAVNSASASHDLVVFCEYAVARVTGGRGSARCGWFRPVLLCCPEPGLNEPTG